MRAIERRSYLRFSDSAIGTHRVVSDDDIRNNTLAELLDLPKNFHLRKDLYRLELEAQELRREISEMDRKLGSFLHNFNQRLETMASILIDSEILLTPNVIDISPAGISLQVDHLFPADTQIAIKLVFPETRLALACFARVRYAILSDNDQYRTGLQFTTLDTTTEALIERHIMSLQAKQRRQRLYKI